MIRLILLSLFAALIMQFQGCSLFDRNVSADSGRMPSEIEPVSAVQAPASIDDYYPPEHEEYSNSQQKLPVIHREFWTEFYNLGEESQGYGMYTYVLSGRGNLSVENTLRYRRLVAIIKDQTVEFESKRSKGVDEYKINQFFIPCYDGQSSKSFCDEFGPDTDFSKLILGEFTELVRSKKVRRELMSNPGPFLISVINGPVRSHRRDGIFDILYVDLTHMHEASFGEVVKTYIRKSNEYEGGVRRIWDIKDSLLSVALSIADNIGIAKGEYKKVGHIPVSQGG